jgi:hypothetical protein
MPKKSIAEKLIRKVELKLVNVAAPVGYSTPPRAFSIWQLITQEDPVGMTGGYSTIFDHYL